MGSSLYIISKRSRPDALFIPIMSVFGMSRRRNLDISMLSPTADTEVDQSTRQRRRGHSIQQQSLRRRLQQQDSALARTSRLRPFQHRRRPHRMRMLPVADSIPAPKLAFGIGTVGAAFLIIAVILLSLLVRRRRRKRRQEHNGLRHTGAPGVPPYAAGSYRQESNNKAHLLGQGTDGSYTGFKYELPAEGQRLPMASPYQSSALTVSPHLSTVSPDHLSVSNASTLNPGYMNGSGSYVSPQSTGTTGSLGVMNHHAQTGPVSEMQG